MFYWDSTYLLVIIGFVISILASAMVDSAMSKYHKVNNSTGITGAECARRILDNEGLYQVQVEELGSDKGDHFDPAANAVRLSRKNFHGRTLTAMGVAAHECGHAIQHAQDYTPIRIRTALVPVVNIGSQASMPLIFLGILLSWNFLLIRLGIIAFSLTVIFQLATLPVEFNASSRALERLERYGIVTQQENRGCRKVLSAAAMTYVAGVLAAVLQLLRLVLLFGGGRRRDD
ncbi:MAG: zinc metallopeptidase [bacterium]|nr:zinc metallopeptidase [bacterium]MCM1376513.1 zinc metallopeptidase [Muribaculum sp.]MCM1410835.1 zinc metallopeptidase [Lachnospiraceae bacterium]